MKNLRNLTLALMLALGTVAVAPAAFAGDPVIEAAVAAGAVGERIDGYLGVVGTANAETVRKVQDINNRRRALYEKTAGETGTTVDQVSRIAGEKQVARMKANPGNAYMDESGTWQTAN